VAPEPSRVVPLLRGRFFCTGARNLDSSTLEAEVTHGHMEGRPAPGTASDHSSAYERGARINRSATRRSEHHSGVGEQVCPGASLTMRGPWGGTSAPPLAGCPPAIGPEQLLPAGAHPLTCWYRPYPVACGDGEGLVQTGC